MTPTDAINTALLPFSSLRRLLAQPERDAPTAIAMGTVRGVSQARVLSAVNTPPVREIANAAKIPVAAAATAQKIIGNQAFPRRGTAGSSVVAIQTADIAGIAPDGKPQQEPYEECLSESDQRGSQYSRGVDAHVLWYESKSLVELSVHRVKCRECDRSEHCSRRRKCHYRVTDTVASAGLIRRGRAIRGAPAHILALRAGGGRNPAGHLCFHLVARCQIPLAPPSRAPRAALCAPICRRHGKACQWDRVLRPYARPWLQEASQRTVRAILGSHRQTRLHEHSRAHVGSRRTQATQRLISLGGRDRLSERRHFRVSHGWLGRRSPA